MNLSLSQYLGLDSNDAEFWPAGMYGYLSAFVFAFVFRYLRTVINCLSFWTYESISPLDDDDHDSRSTSKISSSDVSVVFPTLLDGEQEQIQETIHDILVNDPLEIILVTIYENFDRALDLAERLKTQKIRILALPQANKRKQMLAGLREVQTRFTVFSDDDVFWKPRTLEWMLAPFRDPSMGGVGTCQRLRRAHNPSPSQRFWNFLSALYLERRNFDCAATNRVDGGLPCLSGRTVMYRTEILQSEEFEFEFQNERWWGQHLNAADDDNFLTRWMVSHGWSIKIQYSTECEIETTLADDSKYLFQCLRWSRSNWRSNLTTMFVEGHVWRLQPWSTYSVFLTTITAWALFYDTLLLWLCYKATEPYGVQIQMAAFSALITWWFLTKFVKLLGHFFRYPEDILLLPISILFGYLHSITIKPYALWTHKETTWGSRSDAADISDHLRMRRPQTLPSNTQHHFMKDWNSASRRMPHSFIPKYPPELEIEKTSLSDLILD